MTQDRHEPALTAAERITGVHTHDGTARDLKQCFAKPATPDPAPFKYAASVLRGIGVTAPHRHNGAVPTLADRATTPTRRLKVLPIGPAYNPDNVGLAPQQTTFADTLNTTSRDDRASGIIKPRHDLGTGLPPDPGVAPLEYLKMP